MNNFNSKQCLEMWLEMNIQKSTYNPRCQHIKWNLEERTLTRATKIYKAYKSESYNVQVPYWENYKILLKDIKAKIHEDVFHV